jgi:hypothetical protein
MNDTLDQSQVDRQNILNNEVALAHVQKHLGLTGMQFDGEYWFTVAQTAEFFEVNLRTVQRLIEKCESELKHNGYQVLKGERLKTFKLKFGYLIYMDLDESSQNDIDVALLNNLTQKQRLARMKALGVFNFRAFLNVAMLLTESDRAKHMRSVMLDVVLDVFNEKLGGSTKFINQRDEDFMYAIVNEPAYRKEFTSALNKYLDMGNYKYSVYTDKIYQAIFKENALEYKRILQLEEKDNERNTMYSEVLKLIASFETGLAYEMRKKFEKNDFSKLTPKMLDDLFAEYAIHPSLVPLIESAQTTMASRDYCLRQTLHEKLQNKIRSLSANDFERFLGESSKTIQERIEENIDVFKRLKDR